MDLNDFIFRDDTMEPLGAKAADSDDLDAETSRFITPAKIGLAAIAAAVLSMPHFLGHAKHL
jgi:hypothetical protein